MTLPEKLARVSASRLSDQVAAEIKRLLAQGAYPPGTRLPSGQELAEQLGVTRLTVREALAQPEAAGLTKTRHGSGTYVVDPVEHATLRVLAETLGAGRAMTTTEIESLLEFRTVVILGFAEALARNTLPEHLARLRAIVAEERTAVPHPQKLAALDYRFNLVLAAASGNLFYTLLLRSLREAHEHLGEIVFRHCGDTSVVVDTEEAIVRAVAKRDPAAVHRRLKKYLEGGRQVVAAWIESSRS